MNHLPKAMPWALINCPFGTQNEKGILKTDVSAVDSIKQKNIYLVISYIEDELLQKLLSDQFLLNHQVMLI